MTALTRNRARRSALIAPVLLAALIGGCGESPAPADPPAEARAQAPDEQAVMTAIEAVEHYVAAEDLASAEAVAGRLVERAPRDARARELLGRVLLTRAITAGSPGGPGSRLDRAYEEYRAAAEIDPSGGGLHQNAGSIAAMLGRPEDALRHYLAAEEADPLNAQHPLYAAQVLIGQQRYAEARAALERVLTIDPDEPMAEASLAVVALEQQRLEEAIERIERARSLDPASLDLRIMEARIRRRTGHPERSVQLLAGLDAEVRATEAVTSELAGALAAAGRHGRAAEAWLHRYRSRPQEPEIWRAALRAAESLLRADRRDDAWLWLQEARLLAPDDAEVQALEARLTATAGPGR
jgi:Tfp pilus assembly protein PilF